jgi:hypothetical protein
MWIGGDKDCLHEIDHMEDPELQELDEELDEIIDKINRSTARINSYTDGLLDEHFRIIRKGVFHAHD